MKGTSFLISIDDVKKHYNSLTGLNHSEKFIEGIMKRASLVKGKYQLYPSPIGFKTAEQTEKILIENNIPYEKIEIEYIKG